MSDDIEALQATLKRLVASKDADAEANLKALMLAMQGVQAALSELLAMGEKGDDGAEAAARDESLQRIVQAIEAVRRQAAQGVVDRPVRAGTSFSNDAEIQHAALNVGTQTTRYLIIEKKYADTRTPEAVAPGLCAR